MAQINLQRERRPRAIVKERQDISLDMYCVVSNALIWMRVNVLWHNFQLSSIYMVSEEKRKKSHTRVNKLHETVRVGARVKIHCNRLPRQQQTEQFFFLFFSLMCTSRVRPKSEAALLVKKANCIRVSWKTEQVKVNILRPPLLMTMQLFTE